MPKFEENALYVGRKSSKKLAMLKKILMLFMSENAKNYAGLFYRWLPATTVHTSAVGEEGRGLLIKAAMIPVE